MTRMTRITRPTAIRAGVPLLAVAMVVGLSACSAAPDAEIEVPAEAAPPESVAPDDSTAPDDEQPAARDVCALLSGVDTAALVGVEMSAGTNQGDVCIIEPADSASNGALWVEWVEPGGAARYAQQRELLGVTSEVPGFGDQAFFTGIWLLAVRGDEFLAFEVVPDLLAGGGSPSDADVLAAAETVASNAGW